MFGRDKKGGVGETGPKTGSWRGCQTLVGGDARLGAMCQRRAAAKAPTGRVCENPPLDTPAWGWKSLSHSKARLNFGMKTPVGVCEGKNKRRAQQVSVVDMA